jgi:uncharacterized membrane protein
MAERISENTRAWRLWHHRLRPHSAFVHFPITLIPLTLLSQILFIITGRLFFFNAAFYTLVLSLFAVVFAVGTGVISWMINYDQSFDTRFRVKIACSIISVIIIASSIALTLSQAMLQGVNPVSNLNSGFIASAALTFINCVVIHIAARNGKNLTWL